MKLRIKSNNCRLECEYSESEKPYWLTMKGDIINPDLKKTRDEFESSFKPIQLSESVQKYILNEFGYYLYVSTPKELSPTECKIFEVEQIPMESNAGLGGYILRLKEPVAPSTELIEQSQDEVRKEAVKFAEWISDKEYFKSMNEKGEWYVLNYSDNDSENVTKTIANTTEELFTIYKNNG